jgi:hypothetical protein
MRFLLLISDAGRADTYATNIRLRTLATGQQMGSEAWPPWVLTGPELIDHN